MPHALSTDLYQLMMAAGHHAVGTEALASFELSVRTLPATRGFLVAAGLEQALDLLETVRFTGDDIAYLRSVPALTALPATFFDEFLPRFRFTGEVWAVPEGVPVFPSEPLMRVTAPIAEAQLVETSLLATVLFQTSVASRAVRIVDAAAGRPVVEFGSRRAHGLEAAVLAARAAFLGGCSATSNPEAGRRFGIPLSGTMAHAWVMSHQNETQAFERYAAVYDRAAVFVLDTYDTLAAARALTGSGLRPRAVRLDSGQLGRLSRSVRAILDSGGLRETSIFASGDLDEHMIAALVADDAPIDGFGVGTALSTVSDAPALSGVYKMVEVARGGRPAPTVKRSPGKETRGGCKQVWRIWSDGRAHRDLVALAAETGPPGGTPLLELVMRAGRRVRADPPLADTRRRCAETVGRLPPGVRRLVAPDVHPVDLSPALKQHDGGGGAPMVRTGADATGGPPRDEPPPGQGPPQPDPGAQGRPPRRRGFPRR